MPSRLQDLLNASAADPEGDRTAFFRALSAAKLLVMLEQPVSKKGDPLQCVMLEDAGQVVLPAFTDVEALRLLEPARAHWTQVETRVICRLALEGAFDRVVLNPAGPVGLELSGAEIQSIAEGLIPTGQRQVVVDREVEIKIGVPADKLARRVIDEMRQAAAQPGVREAWWFWMSVGEGRPHLGLAVDPPDPAVVAAVAGQIEPIWAAYRPSNPTFDVLELNDVIRQHGRLLYRSGTATTAGSATTVRGRGQST